MCKADAGTWKFRQYVDWGRGGGWCMDETDCVWSDDGGYTIYEWEGALAAGDHSYVLLGFETCCDGNAWVQVQSPLAGEWAYVSTDSLRGVYCADERTLVLSVDSVPRAVVAAAALAAVGFNTSLAATHTVCAAVHALDGDVALNTRGECDGDTGDGADEVILNPPVAIVNGSTQAVLDAAAAGAFVALADVDDVFILENAPVECALPLGGDNFARAVGGGALLHAPHFRALENTLDAPCEFAATAAQACPAVPKSFLNAQACIVSDETERIEWSGGTNLALNATMIRELYVLTGQHVHYIEDLRTDDVDPPCGGGTSRWRRVDSNCAGAVNAELDNATEATLTSALLAAASGDDDFVRDIEASCDGDVSVGVRLNVTSEDGAVASCWQHAHPDSLNVYDFSRWVVIHNGNDDARDNGHRNPIAAFADRGESAFVFPAWHAMSVWESEKDEHTLLGRLGDAVHLRDLPTELQSVALGERLGAVGARPRGGVESCGSPNEVANEPCRGNMYFEYMTSYTDYYMKTRDSTTCESSRATPPPSLSSTHARSRSRSPSSLIPLVSRLEHPPCTLRACVRSFCRCRPSSPSIASARPLNSFSFASSRATSLS